MTISIMSDNQDSKIAVLLTFAFFPSQQLWSRVTISRGLNRRSHKILSKLNSSDYLDLGHRAIGYFFRRANIIMIKLYQLLVLLSLFSSAFAYALDGSWTLRTSEIPQLKKISAGIVFSFDSKLSVSQDQQISHILTIYACNKLTYSYSVQDDLIFFEYIQTGSQSRPCLSG